MLTIAKLRLVNWKCLPEVELDLGPRAYAIVARHETDRGRSNWAGKSSLVEAIDYALWGRLPRGCRTKRDWIARGEKKGEVGLALSDGSTIVRALGTSSEKLWWNPGSKDARPASQDAAQALIERAVGLDKDDYLATCYFRQREMARIVTCDPGTRMDLVAGWIRLAPLQACEEDASARLRELCRAREQIDHHERTERALAAGVLQQYGAQTAEDLRRMADQAESDAEGQRSNLELAREELARFAELSALAPQAARYEAIVAEGKRLAAQVVEPVDPDELARAADRAHAAIADYGVASDAVAAKSRIAAGRFDGGCPLVGEQCPARAFVEGNRDRNAAGLKDAVAQRAALDLVRASTQQAFALLQERARNASDRERRLADLRAEATRLKPAWRRHALLAQVGGADEAALRASEAARISREADQLAYQTRSAVAAYEKHLEGWKSWAQESAGLEAKIRTAAAAVAVFGKNGAQRRVAEGALVDVERRANETLATAGIELGVRISWSREGSGLAGNCSACGQAFPTSARAKVCERCGAERGPNLVNKLDLELTDRSGAAEDLAGIATQMAAAAWLRADRTSDWGVAVLDEPTGALDASNRQAFAVALPKILAAGGFAQSFTIAHHAGILDSLPGRIEIVSDGRRSTAGVIA
jgi:DNA repair exonuclease SbcCD ATPase subunit